MKDYKIRAKVQIQPAILQILRRNKDITVNGMKEDDLSITIESDNEDELYTQLLQSISSELSLSAKELTLDVERA